MIRQLWAFDLEVSSLTLNRKNVKEKAIFYKNYVVCPIKIYLG